MGDFMDYKDYQKSRDAAWELLIRMKIRSLPIKISEICFALGIKLKYSEDLIDTDGYSFFLKDIPCIVIRKTDNIGRLRFTVAHELGHILLGHVGMYELVNREPAPNDDPIEQAANVFAIRLLAPACVLWGLNVTSAEQISQICDISLQAAQFRMQHLKELYRRNKFLTSRLEKVLYFRFRRFIKENRFE